MKIRMDVGGGGYDGDKPPGERGQNTKWMLAQYVHIVQGRFITCGFMQPDTELFCHHKHLPLLPFVVTPPPLPHHPFPWAMSNLFSISVIVVLRVLQK